MRESQREDSSQGIAGVPYSWQSRPELKATVQAYFTQEAQITLQQLETIRAYCLYVIRAPCYYETQAEDERQALERRLEGVETTEALRHWLVDALKFGVDPF